MINRQPFRFHSKNPTAPEPSETDRLSIRFSPSLIAVPRKIERNATPRRKQLDGIYSSYRLSGADYPSTTYVYPARICSIRLFPIRSHVNIEKLAPSPW